MVALARPVEGKYQPRHITAFDGMEYDRGGGFQQLSIERAAAESGSRQLRVSLLRYGVRYGLPNLSSLQCINELRLLDRILTEDLALADRIEAELRQPPVYKVD